MICYVLDICSNLHNCSQGLCSTYTCVYSLGTIELAASQLADKLSNQHISEVRMWAIDVRMLFNLTSHGLCQHNNVYALYKLHTYILYIHHIHSIL